MSDIAIRVDGLGKRYRIGASQAPYRTLRETLVGIASAPARRIRRTLTRGTSVTHENTIWALRDVSFEVRKGEVLGIIGRNGAGKSTLLKILSRITKPTEGHADLFGRVGSLLEVGTGFHPELTGRENIFLNGAILGMRRVEIEHKFDEIVAFAEIEKFLDTPVKHYSSGMYVRLAFAVAAHLEPEILIVDEVLAVGDAAFQRKCLGKIGEVGDEGRTVVMVSHNMQFVRSLCRRGIVLDSGRIAVDADTQTAVSTYLDRIGVLDRAMPEAPPGHVKRALIDRLQIVQDRNRDQEGPELRFKIVCFEGVDDVSLGFSIHDEEGRTLLVSYSGPHTLFNLAKGVHVIQAHLGLFPVTPGLYTVRARMESRGSELDWPRGDLGEFEISSMEEHWGMRSEAVKNGQLSLFPAWSIGHLEGGS